MQCENPFIKGGHAFGCGWCMSCRYKKRKIWTTRILLEAAQHTDNAFLTLTYAPESLVWTLAQPQPFETAGPFRIPTLVPQHARDFLKRLRNALAPIRIRFFLVGEYGDLEERPHFHAIIFGMKTCALGKTLEIRGKPAADQCCAMCGMIHEQWGKGLVELSSLTEGRARYCAQYTVKKMTAPDDFRLLGRHPEFTRQSNRRGIGYDAMFEVASIFMSHKKYERQADVPAALEAGGKLMPIGRYLRRELRKMVGRDPNAPPETLNDLASSLQPLLETAEALQKNSGRTRAAIFKDLVVEAGATLRLSQAAKEKIFKPKRNL